MSYRISRRPSAAFVSVAVSASAWLLTVAALVWERPDQAFCEHRSAQVTEALILAAVAMAVAATAIGTGDALRSGRVGEARSVGIATSLVGLATLVGTLALYVLGDAFLYANC
jgi:hypothetical protein